MFKTKQFFGSFALVTIFGLIGFSGCSNSRKSHNLNITLAINGTGDPTCVTPEWTYTDFVPSGFCILSDNYGGDSLNSYQVAGTCTTLWQNASIPGSTSQLIINNIFIDCATGSLFSSSFYNAVKDGAAPTIASGQKGEVTVTCSVYGQVRAQKTVSYFSTPSCSSGP